MYLGTDDYLNFIVSFLTYSFLPVFVELSIFIYLFFLVHKFLPLLSIFSIGFAFAHIFLLFFSIPPITSTHVRLVLSLFLFFVIFASQVLLAGLFLSIPCTRPHQHISLCSTNSSVDIISALLILSNFAT